MSVKKYYVCSECEAVNEGDGPCPKCASSFAATPGSAPVFALPYDDLQKIHKLVGWVCGSRMNLPTEMIESAHEVHHALLAMSRIDETQRQRMKEAKAFIARFNTMFEDSCLCTECAKKRKAQNTEISNAGATARTTKEKP